MEQTSSYYLTQWEPGDRPGREEWNEGMAAIDQALAGTSAQIGTVTQRVVQLEEGQCRLASGAYVGNGAESRWFSLGFAPRAVLLERSGGLRSSSDDSAAMGGLALVDHPLSREGVEQPGAWITGSGFYVSGLAYYQLNREGATYHYVALD